jgi:PAS domain S-box-containing protein
MKNFTTGHELETERQHREETELALHQSEEIFRLLVGSVTDYAIFMLDPTGHVTTWNRGAQRIKGYSTEEILGQHFSIFYPPEAIARGWPSHELAVAAAEGRFEDEGWRLRKDGSTFWANVIITVVYDKGRHCGFSKVTRDLTEKKRWEGELQQARHLLEERVEQRTEELTRANEALQVEIKERESVEQELRQLERRLRQKVDELAAADRRKNEFLATLAHELRNPLAPIRHGLQLLHLADSNPNVRRQAHGIMERQLQQMVRLVDDLLDVARLTSKKLRIRKELTELALVVQNAVEAVQLLITGAGHELTVTLPPEPVYLYADLTRLAQILINLLNNAAKYTERGGHIWLTIERQDEEIVVSVRDTGIGLAADHLPHLFDIFSQVTPALDRSEGGLGIGLSLVRGLVELHGGKIEARSAGLGMGSEFLVRLPVVEALGQEQLDPSDQDDGQESPSAGPKYRILVADDNRDSADSLSTLLELRDYEVQTAYDGFEALQLASSFRPRVALLDIGMPRINGYDSARKIRQQAWGKDMVLIAITGWGQDEDKQIALEAGFDYHLTKPIDPGDLEKLLKSVTR